ncbi:imidazole glycerol phosphate synthase subunit HisH [Candidatus Roizmanbacteria bacterium]|nr:imidazole glycerol phosphate synthase subunit HisH [Candidatus Roizmanbacteria bacterium]
MIVIIDYGVGNLGSVKNTLDRLSIESVISDDSKIIKKSDALILPGVGSANQGMKNLIKRKLDSVILREIQKGKPFLGICLGMQLLFSFSEEGNTSCLNIIKGKVRKFSSEYKIPQIGWNTIQSTNKNRFFGKIPNNSQFYFVNSYYCIPEDRSLTIATAEYGVNFCSILNMKNIVATQFHPEKSGEVGQQFIINWTKLW